MTRETNPASEQWWC